MSLKGDLEKTKQVFTYIREENISEEEIRGTIFRSDYDVSIYAPMLLDQILQCNQIETVKLPAFLISEVPSFLCSMSEKGNLEKIKQIFAYVNQENISVEEMGVKSNEVNQGKKPTLVDTKSGDYGDTPLITALSCGHHHVCQYLIKEQKANLEARDDYQMTALIHAAALNKLEVMKVLLQNKANCKAKDKLGSHAAYEAAWFGYLDGLMMLVEKDGDVIDLKGFDGETPLIAASREGMVDVCKYLVEEMNANVNLKNNNGKTALQHARSPEIIAILKNKTDK